MDLMDIMVIWNIIKEIVYSCYYYMIKMNIPVIAIDHLYFNQHQPQQWLRKNSQSLSFTNDSDVNQLGLNNKKFYKWYIVYNEENISNQQKWSRFKC